MYTRRTALGTVGVCVAALAGCSRLDDALDEALDQEAEPAAVEASAAAATGLQQTALTAQVYEQTVDIADESRELRLQNWLTQYTTGATETSAAGFSLLTTPTVSVAGQAVNPFRQFDRERLLQAMVERADAVPVESIETVGERTVTVLDESVPVEVFRAEGEQDPVQLRLHLGDRTHNGDILVFLGVHPAVVETTEAIDTLAEGITHPVERP